MHYTAAINRGIDQTMKKSELQRHLSHLNDAPQNRADREQYQTPPDIAAELVWQAAIADDLGTVIDLGTGNGILALGAAALGATVHGYDIDEDAIACARENRSILEERLDTTLDVAFEQADVRDIDQQADTAVMNPPFGIQQSQANRPFLDAAFRNSSTVYALLHQSEKNRDGTRRFIASLADEAGFTAEILGWFRFGLDNTKSFHTKRKKHIKVDLYKFSTSR